jgi:hypothetical protein
MQNTRCTTYMRDSMCDLHRDDQRTSGDREKTLMQALAEALDSQAHSLVVFQPFAYALHILLTVVFAALVEVEDGRVDPKRCWWPRVSSFRAYSSTILTVGVATQP